MTEAQPEYDERPRRRGRKVLISLLVLLLVLVGLLVVADRIASGVAERAIGDQVRQELTRQDASAARPEVEVGGFPFLTQVLDGTYERIIIRLRDVKGTVEGNSVSLPVLDVDARNVTASLDTIRSGQGDVRAERVDGTGTVSYESLATLLDRPGLKLSEQDGKLMVTAPLEILGVSLTVTGAAEVTVNEEGKVALRFSDLDAEGLPNLPAARLLLNNYARSISINVPLPELPFQLTLREVRPTPEGLAVTADAQDVPINSLG